MTTMTIADIAELHKSIAIARYALAHIGTQLEDGDVDIADQALTKAAHIMHKFLGEDRQEKAEEELDAEGKRGGVA